MTNGFFQSRRAPYAGYRGSSSPDLIEWLLDRTWGDPLEMIDRVVRFESFRAEIEAATLTPASKKKSNAGRKPIDVIVMFRMLVLQIALQSVRRTAALAISAGLTCAAAAMPVCTENSIRC